jgi:hypothetical protein
VKSISPKDESILATIAQNPGMSVERLEALLAIADDPEEIRPEARLLLFARNDTPVPFSPGARSAAEGLAKWARENRAVHTLRTH